VAERKSYFFTNYSKDIFFTANETSVALVSYLETLTFKRHILMINQDNVLKQFLEVTAIPGTSKNERQIIEYLKHFLQNLGFDYYEDNACKAINGDSGNLICKIHNSDAKKESYLLAAHVDTVTLSCDSPAVKNGRVVSSNNSVLGADDRVGVTVLLEILKLIADKKIDYPNLEIVFLVAEEIGLLGSKNLDYSKISSTKGFNLDCSASVGQVVVEATGAMDFEISFLGREAHSAVAPEKGINAISMASETIHKLHLPQKNGDTIFNVGKIKGGKKNNIIPGEVVVNGEIRSLTPGKIDVYVNTIYNTAKSVVSNYGGKFNLNKNLRYNSFKLDENSTVFKIVKSAVEDSNKKFMPISYLAGSDANIFNQKNIAAVNIGLGYVNNHSSNEYVLISDLLKDVEIGAKIVQFAAKANN